MDAADITTLIERCTASELARPVAAIMRQASEFEPLLVTIAGKRPIRILADSRPQAIALASEAAVAGQAVRVGLAQLDADDLKAAGLTVAAAFDPCEHIAGVGRMLQDRRARRLTNDVDDAAASEQAMATFKSARTAKSVPVAAKPDIAADPAKEAGPPEKDIASAKDPPSWSVYGAQRGSSLLIYSR